MANILYRESIPTVTPVASSVKGLPITHSEFDANLKSIDNDIQTRATMITLESTANSLLLNTFSMALILG